MEYQKKEKETRFCSCGNSFETSRKSRKYCDECLKKLKLRQCKRDGRGGLLPLMTMNEYNEKRKKGEIKNGMAGRSIHDVWVEKYGVEEADKKWSESVKKQQESFKINHSTLEQKQEFISKSIHKGSSNGMYGRSVYDVWVEKYGVEEADKRRKEMCEKQSKKTKGKNNPMYGKPAPKGSGNGISGWYKGWYFRSLRELSYMINVIEKEGHKWRSLDNTSDFRIKYIDTNGHERSYCPDFLIDDKAIIEIKPKKLQELDNVVRKENAAILFCQTRKLTYVKTDIEIMDFSILSSMIENKTITLTEKSFLKYEKFKHNFQRRKNHESE